MLTCTITDFSCPPQTVKSSCRARFTVSISVDKQPLVEIHNCVLLYNQKLQTYYIGFPGYKRGNRYDNIASVVSPEMNAEIIAAAVHILGQKQ